MIAESGPWSAHLFWKVKMSRCCCQTIWNQYPENPAVFFLPCCKWIITSACDILWATVQVCLHRKDNVFFHHTRVAFGRVKGGQSCEASDVRKCFLIPKLPHFSVSTMLKWQAGNWRGSCSCCVAFFWALLSNLITLIVRLSQNAPVWVSLELSFRFTIWGMEVLERLVLPWKTLQV